jgi:hypothetical protein
MSEEQKGKNKVKLEHVVLGIIILTGLFFVLPMLNAGSNLPKISGASPQGAPTFNGIGAQNENNILNIQVQIPCGGHTSLIISEMSKLAGVISVNTSSWNKFEITFDPTKTNKEQIVGAKIFSSYPATILN